MKTLHADTADEVVDPRAAHAARGVVKHVIKRAMKLTNKTFSRAMASAMCLAGLVMHVDARAQAAESPVGANGTTAAPVANSSGGDKSGTVSPKAAPPMPVPATACIWPQFDAFIKAHVQADGRVIDYGPPVQTTSEGQSYGLFFALVNNDRSTFDRVLNWTQSNLSAGDLIAHLPAWRWGQRADNSYGVIDQNSAADSDLWIAYDLAEAGRLWREPRYTTIAKAMFVQIANREVFDLPGFGPMLAPGSVGFALAADLWRLNPSYTPLPLLRVAAQLDPTGPWQQIAVNTVKMIQASSPHGFTPDWLAYQTGKGFVVDPVKGDVGSYDAIRVYLWAGLTSRADSQYKPLLAAIGGMQASFARSGQPPEKVATLTGAETGVAPIGFSAALLPYLRATSTPAAYSAARARVDDLVGRAPLRYYDHVLTLFGQGAAEGRYQFNARGRLTPDWSTSCTAGTR